MLHNLLCLRARGNSILYGKAVRKSKEVSGQGQPPRRYVRRGGGTLYYTLGPDRQGVCRNAYVAWELYGPNDQDYRFLGSEDLQRGSRARPKGFRQGSGFS